MPSNITEQLRQEYTQHYRDNDACSTIGSRRQLCQAIIDHALQSPKTVLNVLDIGAGKQILEKELTKHPQFPLIRDKLRLVTLDIADLTNTPLLAQHISHVTADATHTPFAAASFDLIISNLALDYMPRSVWAEVKRLLKPDGTLLCNLHHPNLIAKAHSLYPQVMKGIRQLRQKITRGRNPVKRERYQTELADLLIAKRDLEFILYTAPNMIYANCQAIEGEIIQIFAHQPLVEEVFSQNGDNGHYAIRLDLQQADHE